MGTPAAAASPGHGHAGLLSIQCSTLGEPIVADPGNEMIVIGDHPIAVEEM
ncbi:MAG: hypothetical protein HXY51_00595 [Nitrospirae bacterium]|nr:hypothetical protein [Nitrospirota bacterium]